MLTISDILITQGAWLDFTLDQAIIDELGDQGGGKFSFRFVCTTSGGSLEDTTEVAEVIASLTAGSSSSNDIDVEIEWSVTDIVNTMDYIRWDFSTSGTATTEFYVWKDTCYELQVGSSPLNLTTDYYDEATNTIKVKFMCNDSSSSFILYIDQLRVDYTVLISSESNDTLEFYALFDENSGSSTFDKKNFCFCCFV